MGESTQVTIDADVPFNAASSLVQYIEHQRIGLFNLNVSQVPPSEIDDYLLGLVSLAHLCDLKPLEEAVLAQLRYYIHDKFSLLEPSDSVEPLVARELGNPDHMDVIESECSACYESLTRVFPDATYQMRIGVETSTVTGHEAWLEVNRDELEEEEEEGMKAEARSRRRDLKRPIEMQFTSAVEREGYNQLQQRRKTTLTQYKEVLGGLEAESSDTSGSSDEDMELLDGYCPDRCRHLAS